MLRCLVFGTRFGCFDLTNTLMFLKPIHFQFYVVGCYFLCNKDRDIEFKFGLDNKTCKTN